MMVPAVGEGGQPMALAGELDRARRGDADAIPALVSRYQQRLYRYLLRLARDPATAEDLFQQTWLHVVRSLRSYEPDRSFEGWLFTVAHNLAMDHFRRRQPEALDEMASEPQAPEPDALEQVLESERGRKLAAALMRLPAMHREVIALRFEEGMKIEEIAEVTGVPLSTVKSRLARALESLRRRLEAYERTRTRA